MFNPTRRANGRGGTRAANSDAAGRLFTTTLKRAPTTAVSQESRCDKRVAGPDQVRPTVPRATATPKRPTRTGSPRTPKARPVDTSEEQDRMTVATTPTAATGAAGDRRTITNTVTVTTATSPTPSTGRSSSDTGATVARRRTMFGTANDQGGHQRRCDRRWGHVPEELSSREVEMAEDDQVGQIRAGQQQRSGIGQEEAPVEKRCLPFPALAGGVDQDGREERHRGVEIQHRRHADDQHHRTDVEDQPIRRQAGEHLSGGGEQSVLVGDETHQEKARHEDEGGPVLCRGGPGIIWAEQRSAQCSRTSNTRQGPPEPTRGAGARCHALVRTVAHSR